MATIKNVNILHKRLGDVDYSNITPLDGQFIIQSSNLNLKTKVGNIQAEIKLKTLENICTFGGDPYWNGNKILHTGNAGTTAVNASSICGFDYCYIDNKYTTRCMVPYCASINNIAYTIPVRNADKCIVSDVWGNARTATQACSADKINGLYLCEFGLIGIFVCSVAGTYINMAIPTGVTRGQVYVTGGGGGGAGDGSGVTSQAGGSGTGVIGSNGQPSTFLYDDFIITANGGGGGKASLDFTSIASAINGDININGAGVASRALDEFTKAGAPSYWGGGGEPVLQTGKPAKTATVFGSGGGNGNSEVVSGGAGAPGVVIVYWYK